MENLGRMIVLVVAIATTGCGSTPPPDDDAAVALAGDGWHRIAVSLQDGTQDEMWIYASSMGRPGPLPVVIYGHGQGVATIANCSPDGRPQSPVVAPAVEFSDALAERGYLAIAIFTATSVMAPPPPEASNHVMDTSTMRARSSRRPDGGATSMARAPSMRRSSGPRSVRAPRCGLSPAIPAWAISKPGSASKP